MHLYYNAHDKSDLRKLGELLSFESSVRNPGDNKSESPEPEGLKRQVNFIFRTINGINAVTGLIFLLSGIIIFFEFRKVEADFGTSAFVIVSFVLGLCGITFFIYSALGFMLTVRSLQQMLLYAIGGGFVFVAMIFACAVRIPNTSVLLRNVSSEMMESLYLSKNGDPIQRAKWTYVQNSLHCCGVLNFWDWCEPKNVTHEQQGFNPQCAVPPSCFSNNSSDRLQDAAAIQIKIDPHRPIFVRGCYSLQMETLHLNINLYRSFGYLRIILVGFAVLFAIFLMMVFHR
uniref:Tetraspanin-15 n=1 Tax=Lygus hesperus TaxID=30085 RepID=A0A0A9WSN3_LYGHE